MATIYDAIKGEIQTSDEYLADDPFYNAGAKLRQAQLQPETNSQAIWGPIVQALIGGVLTGIGKRRAREEEFDAYKASGLQEALAANLVGTEGTEGFGPVASGDTYGKNIPILNSVYMQEDAPNGWTGKQGKTDLLKALVQQEAETKKKEREDEFLFEKGLQRGATGSIEANTPMIEALAKQEELLTAAKVKAKGAGEVYDKLSDAEKVRYASVKPVADQLDDLAKKAADMKATAVGLGIQSAYSGSKYNELKAQLEVMLPSIRKAASDTGNAAVAEQATTLEALMGGMTAGSDTIARNLRNAAKLLRETAKGSLEGRIAGEGNGVAAVLQGLSQASATAPSGGIPEGAVLVPGKINKNTGKPVYLVNGKPWSE